jgi:hypothetical protein
MFTLEQIGRVFETKNPNSKGNPADGCFLEIFKVLLLATITLPLIWFLLFALLGFLDGR